VQMQSAAEGGFLLSYLLPWLNVVSHPSLLASRHIHPHQAPLTPALPAQAPARLCVFSLQPKPNPDSLSWESGEQRRLAGSSFLEKTFILIVSRDNYWVFSAIDHRRSAGKRAELAAKHLVCACRGGKGLRSCWEVPEQCSWRLLFWEGIWGLLSRGRCGFPTLLPASEQRSWFIFLWAFWTAAQQWD